MTEMNEERAREVLGGWITATNVLGGAQWGRLSWFPHLVPHLADLSGSFTADQLEAIAWWMRNKGAK